ncbi:MAG: hypothetical protein ACRDL8_12710, partial [Solirubrobacteraceae bacterium]
SMTGIATLVLENDAAELPDAEAVNDRRRARMAEQLAGVEELTGTYPFDIARSVKGYRINKFLHDLVDPDHRARFLDEPETAFKEAGLSEQEQDLIRNRDWPGMIHYGVIFFMLEKLAAVTGESNLHVYAAMRGETLEEFLQTRNTRVIYSVAGKKDEMRASVCRRAEVRRGSVVLSRTNSASRHQAAVSWRREASQQARPRIGNTAATTVAPVQPQWA